MAIAPGEGEFWKEYKGQLKKAMNFVSDHGVSVLDLKEIKSVASPIIREAKKRIRALEREGLTDSPAYRYYVRNNIKFTAAGRNLNAIKHNLKEAWTFLQKQTSTVEGARDFFTKTVDKWVGDFTTQEQREKIWDTYHRLEKIHPGYFLKETYGSDEMAADIYTITQTLNKTDWDVDVALARYNEENPEVYLDENEKDATMRWSGWL